MKGFWPLVFFLLIPVAGVATFVVAPGYKIWLPRDISTHGHVIDGLFMFILWLTGIVFVATEVTLAWFMWKYRERKDAAPVRYTHGSHTLEVCWTILPAATLLFIALYQMNAWAEAKMRPPLDTKPIAEVTGRQFEWRIRYAGADQELHTPDDILTVNDLHLPVNEEILLNIKSADVLHSFFLPNLRMKQDVVPGMQQGMWFRAKETGVSDIVCAELCGWGHYKMKGEITIERREEFDNWLAMKYDAQEATNLPPQDDEEEE